MKILGFRTSVKPTKVDENHQAHMITLGEILAKHPAMQVHGPKRISVLGLKFRRKTHKQALKAGVLAGIAISSVIIVILLSASS